jgi:hypothetical protein
MIEIRVTWSIAGRINSRGIPIQSGVWFPDTPKIRRDLEAIAEAGNHAYEAGTHWVEERRA